MAMAANIDIEKTVDEIEESREIELERLNEKEPEAGYEVESSEESQEEEPVEREETGANFSSVQQYLHEIGSVALLNRERETVLAMQMERGKNQILQALCSIPIALRHVLELGNAVASGELDLRAVIDKAESDSDEGEEVLDPKPFLKLVGKLRNLYEAQERYRRELKRSRLSKQRQALLIQKQSRLPDKGCAVMKELHLSSGRVEEMVQQLKRSAERLVALEQQEGTSRANRNGILAEKRNIEERIGLPAAEVKTQVGLIQVGEALVSTAKKEFTEA